MPLLLPPPAFMPCPECGASVASGSGALHCCDPQRLLDYSLFPLRAELAGFDAELRAWLASPPGCFAVWSAEHERR
jgi:hypothetical protein